jgi:hypothetical protein
MNPEIKKEFSDIIESISDIARKRHEIKKPQLELRDKISVIRARHLINIAMAKDLKGKSKYSNEQLRNAQLVLMLDGDAEYQQLKQKSREFDNEDGLLVIEYSRLSDRRLLLMIEIGIVTPSSPESAEI